MIVAHFRIVKDAGGYPSLRRVSSYFIEGRRVMDERRWAELHTGKCPRCGSPNHRTPGIVTEYGFDHCKDYAELQARRRAARLSRFLESLPW